MKNVIHINKIEEELTLLIKLENYVREVLEGKEITPATLILRDLDALRSRFADEEEQ